MMDRRTARLSTIKVLLQKGYEWFACDKDGTMVAYEVKPFKMTDDEWWNYDSEEPKFLTLDNADDIDFVKWEDEEPTNITEWIKNEEEEMKMYSIKDGKLECEEVDVTNGMVALGVDDVVVPDGATMVKVTARNWGKSFMEEKSKEIRESIQSMEKIYGSDFFERNKTLGGLITPIHHEATLDDMNNVQIHEKVCQELNETYEKKNADYGNSFENSLDKHGLIAGIVRMDDKMSRLISLNSKKEQQVMDESLRDTLMDLANYAIMSVMWLDEQ